MEGPALLIPQPTLRPASKYPPNYYTTTDPGLDTVKDYDTTSLCWSFMAGALDCVLDGASVLVLVPNLGP